MTTTREIVHNRALSGEELKAILLADFQKLLDNEGLLSAYIGFGRVSYDIQLFLHLDNPMNPESESRTTSRERAWNEVDKKPELKALEAPPLVAPSADATVAATNLRRDITSPNEERLRNGMAVPVLVEQQDGTKTTEHVKYPPQEVGEGAVEVTDITRQEKQKRGMPQDPVPLSPTAPVVDHQAIMCKCGRTRGQHALSGIGTPMEGLPPCSEFTPSTAPDKSNAEEAWPVRPS